MAEEEKSLYWLEALMLRAPLFTPADYAAREAASFLADTGFRNALWLASPQLYDALEKLDFDWGKLDARKQLTVRKYLNRACFRPTPFGGFASFSFGNWHREPGARPRMAAARLRLLPSQELLVSASRLPCLRAQLDVRLHPCFYQFGQAFRYPFAESQGDGALRFWLNDLAKAALHTRLFRKLRQGATTMAAVQEFVQRETACTVGEAWKYVCYLMDEQVLLAAGGPGLIGRTGFGDLCPGGETPFPGGPLEPGAMDLPGLARVLESSLPKALHRADRHYFYAALEREGVCTADSRHQARLLAAIEVLRALAQPVQIRLLEQFTREFKQRYDRAAVPLLLATDPDLGISYGVPPAEQSGSMLLNEIAFPAAAPGRLPQGWTAAHRLFFRLWRQDARRGAFDPLVLPPDVLAGLNGMPPAPSLPPSLPVLFREAGGKLLLEHTGGASATALAGRFSCFSDAVHQACLEVARQESLANPGVVFAELSQLSGPHVDNINRRLPVYPYVIPLNTFGGAAEQTVILPDDLVLRVHGEELLLESVSLKQRVIPRLPTAFNYHHNELALFRLLCDLQHPHRLADLSLDLERLFPDETFYPRVEYEGVILCAAKWKFDASVVAPLLAEPLSLGRLHLFREKHGLPAWVSMGFGDQQLVFDLGRDGEARFFLEALKGIGDKLRLDEYLLPDDAAHPAEGAVAAQLLGMLINPEQVFLPAGTTPAFLPKKKRSFLPGSEWLYLKLYCTPRSADELLREVIGPLLRTNRHSVRRWFFIRYEEGGYHLRLRLLGDAAALAGLLPEMNRQLARRHKSQLVRDCQGGVYARELERYGEAEIELAETCFAAGSEWVLRQLGAATGREDAAMAELQALPLVWLMIGVFLPKAEQRGVFLQGMAARLTGEYGPQKALKYSLDQKYRLLKRQLQAALSAPALAEAAAGAEQVLAALQALEEATRPWGRRKRWALIADLIHMQVNRVFRERQLQYETVIYHLLDRFSRSEQARQA